MRIAEPLESIVGARDADPNAGGAGFERSWRQTCIFHGAPRQLQKHPLLRVHGSGFRGVEGEKLRCELIHFVEVAPDGMRTAIRSPALGQRPHRIGTTSQQPLKRLEIRRPGKSARHSHDGDVVARWRFSGSCAVAASRLLSDGKVASQRVDGRIFVSQSGRETASEMVFETSGDAHRIH